MRYTSDSLVAQRNFTYTQSFFFSRGSKRRTRRESPPQNAKSSSSSFFFVFFFASSRVSLNRARREDERDESLHTKLFLLYESTPKRAAEKRGFFDAKKKEEIAKVII